MVNVIGTINIFEAALKAKDQIQGIAYASSAAVFGKPEDHAASEEEAGSPTSHYGAFKRCNEDNARVYFLDNGMSSIGLRPLTVYGVERLRRNVGYNESYEGGSRRQALPHPIRRSD